MKGTRNNHSLGEPEPTMKECPRDEQPRTVIQVMPGRQHATGMDKVWTKVWTVAASSYQAKCCVIEKKVVETVDTGSAGGFPWGGGVRTLTHRGLESRLRTERNKRSL